LGTNYTIGASARRRGLGIFVLLLSSHRQPAMSRYCLTLDLKDDPALIAEYEAFHKKVWPEILDSIREAGVARLEIYRFGTRLCMMLEGTEAFSFEKKAAMDEQNAIVQRWEKLMWDYQQPLPGARPGQKWIIMDKIFELNESVSPPTTPQP
jgi:L-rhamnose mutarotase